MNKRKLKRKMGRLSEADCAVLSYVMQERLIMNMAERRMEDNKNNDDFCQGIAIVAYGLGYDCGKNDDGKWVFERDRDGLPKKDWSRTSEILLESSSPFSAKADDSKEE